MFVIVIVRSGTWKRPTREPNIEQETLKSNNEISSRATPWTMPHLGDTRSAESICSILFHISDVNNNNKHAYACQIK
jgi:hypothetical protein